MSLEREHSTLGIRLLSSRVGAQQKNEAVADAFGVKSTVCPKAVSKQRPRSVAWYWCVYHEIFDILHFYINVFPCRGMDTHRTHSTRQGLVHPTQGALQGGNVGLEKQSEDYETGIESVSYSARETRLFISVNAY